MLTTPLLDSGTGSLHAPGRPSPSLAPSALIIATEDSIESSRSPRWSWSSCSRRRCSAAARDCFTLPDGLRRHWRLQRSSSLPRTRLNRLGLRDGRGLHAHDAAVRQRHGIASRSRTAFAVIGAFRRSSSLPRTRLNRLGLRDGRDLHAHDAAARQRHQVPTRRLADRDRGDVFCGIITVVIFTVCCTLYVLQQWPLASAMLLTTARPSGTASAIIARPSRSRTNSRALLRSRCGGCGCLAPRRAAADGSTGASVL